MQPEIARLLIVTFILGTLAIDARRKPSVSFALWLPLIWLAVIASRPLTEWIHPSIGILGAHAEEGSPIDRAILSLLIVTGTFVLISRRLKWARWMKENRWVFILFAYCGVSIVWSDFPGIAFRRWVRALGSLTMILVVLSDEDPIAAAAALVRRCAYILIPVSFLFVKYFRNLAVNYNPWTGEEYLVGVTTDKNALGRLCLVSAVFVLWDLMRKKPLDDERLVRRAGTLIGIIVLAMTLWLLHESKSATSLASFIAGATVMFGLGLPFFRRNARHIGKFIVASALTVLILAVPLNLMEVVVTSLGRDMTFTDRTFIWHDLLELHTNPVVGVGYDSFWLGDRLDAFIAKHQVYEAHNGYLEAYLELGFVGLFLLGALVFSVYQKGRRSLLGEFDYGRLRLVMVMLFLMYNATEASYKATTLMFFVLLLVSMDPPVDQALQQPNPRLMRPASFRQIPGPGRPAPARAPRSTASR